MNACCAVFISYRGEAERREKSVTLRECAARWGAVTGIYDNIITD